MQSNHRLALTTVVIGGLLMMLAACTGGPNSDQFKSEPLPEDSSGQFSEKNGHPVLVWPLTVANLIDRWDAATEDVLEITKSNNHMYAMGVLTLSSAGKASLEIDHVWGEPERDHVRLTAYARKDNGHIDRLFIHGKQTRNFGNENLELLRPYYEILIAVTNPGLTAEERADAMQQLLLDMDAEAMLEAIDEMIHRGEGAPNVTINGVNYVVDTGIASSEGMTVALVATLAKDCETDVVFPCR